jgi:hypothetical protein
MRLSYTAVIERNIWWEGVSATEPYEAAWAREAIIFIRVLEQRHIRVPISFQVQISPDGMHWCNEGSALIIYPDVEVTFVRVKHFGGWLRLQGEIPPEAALKVLIYINLKE